VTSIKPDLFHPDGNEAVTERLGPGTMLLRGRALALESHILAALTDIIAKAPFRHMTTPGGFQMSVAMTNCGAVGWVSDRTGYRYEGTDPLTQAPWPPMPNVLSRLATQVAAEAGFCRFVADACLINRYEPGTRLSLHQDRNERDFTNPIVSVSLGLPATFELGGSSRADKPKRIAVRHGDILVWGGPSRLAYHGVLALKDGTHPLLGRQRLNLSLRKAR
jgi:alkylated DNA repair protein (DNA oxidative demethylase)